VREQLRGQLDLGRGEIVQVEGLLDLPRVIKVGLVPLGVALHTRRVGDLQLGGDHVQHLGRYRQWIGGQETAQIATVTSCKANPSFDHEPR
jgi:hypothetical protein